MDSVRKKKPLLPHQHHHQNKIPEEILMEGHHIKIPEEIVTEEILPWLPVKSLLRFRCVSKLWLSLIDSDRFIKTQLQNSTLNPDYSHWRVVFNRESGVKQCSMRTYLDEGSLNLSPIHGPTIDEMTTAEIVGSCNGVVCLFNDDTGKFFLWNPATRKHTILPGIERATSNVGFGWDEWSCAFKVFVAVRSDYGEFRHHRGMVYNSDTYSWKETADYEYINSLCGNGTFASGKIHWMTCVRGWVDYKIEFFDLRREVFGRIELPMQPCELGICFYPWMWETRGCLGLISEDEDDERRRRVWVREEECWVEVAKEPWVGLICQSIKTTVGCLEGFFWVESLVSPRRWKKN